jgi:hypothetical protein
MDIDENWRDRDKPLDVGFHRHLVAKVECKITFDYHTKSTIESSDAAGSAVFFFLLTTRPRMRTFCSIVFVISTFLTTTRVFACEGPCIVGVTNVFVSNYTSPVETVFNKMVCRHRRHKVVPISR